MIPNSVAGAAISGMIKAFNMPLFTILKPAPKRAILPFPRFILNDNSTILSIDIGELIAGTTLEIALPSGTIAVKESK